MRLADEAEDGAEFEGKDEAKKENLPWVTEGYDGQIFLEIEKVVVDLVASINPPLPRSGHARIVGRTNNHGF